MAGELIRLGRMAAGEIGHIWPYFLAGVAIGALIRTYRLHVRMRDALGSYGAVAAIPAAVLIGTISPLCSCGAIPIFVSLVSTGVPLAPALTLLLVSPLMSPSGYTITAWELGPAWANLKVFCALFMGFFAGGVTYLLERRGFFGNPGVLRAAGRIDIHAPDCPGELVCHCGDQWSNRLARKGHGTPVIFLAKAWELTLRTGQYTLLGIAAGVLAEGYIPKAWVAGSLGEGSLANIVLVTLFSIPLHVNEITAAALLYSLLDLGLAKGPALAFLVGGPVTSIPAMSVLFTMCRRRVVGAFLAVSLVGTLLLAVAFQLVLDRYPAVEAMFQYAT